MRLEMFLQQVEVSVLLERVEQEASATVEPPLLQQREEQWERVEREAQLMAEDSLESMEQRV